MVYLLRRSTFAMTLNKGCWGWQLWLASCLSIGGAITTVGDFAIAQIAYDVTPVAESSVIVPINNNSLPTRQIDNGATRVTSFFHGARHFSVLAGSVVYFKNAPDFQNIINRVISSSTSNADSLLQINSATKFFLLNPNMIVFDFNVPSGWGFIEYNSSSVKNHKNTLSATIVERATEAGVNSTIETRLLIAQNETQEKTSGSNQGQTKNLTLQKLDSNIATAKDLLPVVTTIIGGLLTALGGFVLQSVARKADKRKLHREKLENIYMLSADLMNWADEQLRQMRIGIAGLVDEEILKKRPPIDQLVMLVRLYEPEILERATNFSEIILKFQTKESEYWAAMSQGMEPQEYLSLIENIYNELNHTRNELINSIAKSIQKYA